MEYNSILAILLSLSIGIILGGTVIFYIIAKDQKGILEELELLSFLVKDARSDVGFL
jgi:hypothetical protein|tara:strand:- start:536 stop:706 length:171 start_codon:yes stop_codon:yes gene_type:complete